MFYLLFIFYLVLFCWFISRLRFFKSSGLPIRILIVLFIIRIFSLLVGCYVNLYILPVSDSLAFHRMGIDEFNLLFSHPHEYFVNIFQDPYAHGYSRLLEDSNSFWNNFRTNLIAKMLSVFDFFSFKNFWINTLFFNFLVFFGCVALYKTFIQLFPKGFSQLIFCIFLFPSALFYTSMIHRDGLIFLSLSMIVYHLFFLMQSRTSILKNNLIIWGFLLLIFLLRNFVFLALIPGLIAWLLTYKFPKKPFLSFVTLYTIAVVAFFGAAVISPKLNFPGYVAERQESFIEIGKAGNSTLPVKKLEPNLMGFIKSAPQAFNLALLRPYVSEIRNLQFIPFALEILLLEILIILFIFFRTRNAPVNPLIYFNVFFSLTVLMMTGYTVPIIGAIVRYRSIYFVFLFIPIVCSINWKKILKVFSFKK